MTGGEKRPTCDFSESAETGGITSSRERNDHSARFRHSIVGAPKYRNPNAVVRRCPRRQPWRVGKATDKRSPKVLTFNLELQPDGRAGVKR
jgi:hypothetical protein